MTLLPASTNSEYRGAPISAWFLALSSVTTIVPGLIHYFLPDGGAGVIGGVDLSTRAEAIIAIFAWYGAMQIPFGILILIIALRYRTLVPLVLLLTILMQALGVVGETGILFSLTAGHLTLRASIQRFITFDAAGLLLLLLAFWLARPTTSVPRVHSSSII